MFSWAMDKILDLLVVLVVAAVSMVFGGWAFSGCGQVELDDHGRCPTCRQEYVRGFGDGIICAQRSALTHGAATEDEEGRVVWVNQLTPMKLHEILRRAYEEEAKER